MVKHIAVDGLYLRNWLTYINCNAQLSMIIPHYIVLTSPIMDNSFPEFIWTLSQAQKDVVLLGLLTTGKGSLDYAKDLAKFDRSVPTVMANKPDWCTCGVCRPVPTDEENKCCKKLDVSPPLSHSRTHAQIVMH